MVTRIFFRTDSLGMWAKPSEVFLAYFSKNSPDNYSDQFLYANGPLFNRAWSRHY